MLPIRWLSPEAVLFGKFTVQSDIYSYGVLLWEVFTFSMQPYYGYTNKEVLEFIAKVSEDSNQDNVFFVWYCILPEASSYSPSFQGIHLAKPDFCPDFVYPIMKRCWSKEPDLRPYYDSIIAALNGEEMMATPKSPEQPDTISQPEYQNFVPFAENGKIFLGLIFLEQSISGSVLF